MWFETILLSAAAFAAVALWTWPPPLRRTLSFALMAIAGGMALVSWISVAAADGAAASHWRLVGWGAVFAIVLMRLVAPMARALAFWAMEREHTRLASAGIELYIALQPGLGGERDRAMVRAYRRALAGNIDAELSNLAAAKAKLPRALHGAIDANQIWLLLLARRHRDAIAIAEQTFGDERPMPLELRLQLLAAYAVVGDDANLATHARVLLAAAQDVPALTKLYRYAALVVLAAAGRVDGTAQWAQSLGNTTTKFVPAYWHAVAALRAGDAAQSDAAVALATRLAKTKRQHASAALLRQEFAANDAAPALAALADELVAQPKPTILAVPRATATYALMLLCVAWSVGIQSLWFGISDTGSLIRGGAGVQALVDEGQWWRLLSASVVHVGAAHLVINLLSLWSVGRIVERLIGAWRTAAVFLVAALVGAIASHLLRDAQVAAGASGGVMGLLGALLVEMRWRKPQALAKGISARVLPVLYFVVAVQVLADMFMPSSDGVAHMAGLIGGAAAAAALGARAGWADRVLRASRLVTLALAIATAASAVFLWQVGPAQWLRPAGSSDVTSRFAALGIDAWATYHAGFASPDEFTAWAAAESDRLVEVTGKVSAPSPTQPGMQLHVQYARLKAETSGDYFAIVWFARPVTPQEAMLGAELRVGRIVVPRAYLPQAWPSLVAWIQQVP